MVSVIIPTYNSTSFIVEAIDSIISQKYNKPIELIIVDDGSKDKTVEIIKNIAYPIKLIQQKNQGRGAARNVGVSNATGKYIAFLDHDDILLPDSISERVSFLESSENAKWVCTDAIEFDEARDLRLYLNQFPWLDLTQDHFCQLLRGCFPLTSTVMIRSDLIRQVGGFNTTIDYGDDIELFLRLFLVSEVGMIRKPLTRRRIHPTQGVSNTFDRWDSRVEIYSNFRPSLGEMNELQIKALKKALKFSYFKLGECYWERNEFAMAKKMFKESFSMSSFLYKALIYAYLCNSQQLIQVLRTMKNI